jgi:putative transposase
LIDDQAVSGVTQRAFCDEHGIGYSSFCWWRRKLSGHSGKGLVKGSAFVEVLSPQPVSAQGWEVDLELGPGMRLRLSGR